MTFSRRLHRLSFILALVLVGFIYVRLHRKVWLDIRNRPDVWMSSSDTTGIYTVVDALANQSTVNLGNGTMSNESFIRSHVIQTSENSFPQPTIPAPSPSPRDYLTLPESMQVYNDTLYPTTINPRHSKIWESSTRLPQWAKDYFAWQQRELRSLNESHWEAHRYLVLICGKSMTCGGTADRLRSVPFFVRLAATTKRLFFIRWERPLPLEALLMPPKGGMDWRMPSFLVDKLKSSRFAKKVVQRCMSQEILIKTKLQHVYHGSDWYTEQSIKNGEPKNAYELHYRDIWYTLFTPVPELALRIETEVVKHGLVPGHYGSIHLRALYKTQSRENNVTALSLQSINCMSTLRGGPFYFASDSVEARRLVHGTGKDRNVTIVTRMDTHPMNHIEFANSTSPSDYFEIFLDLYLLSFGRCLTHSFGGFGTWAQLISGRDFSCRRTVGALQGFALCSGKDWEERPSETSTESLQLPLFLSPMY